MGKYSRNKETKEMFLMIVLALVAAVFVCIPIEMFISYVDHHH